MGGRWLARFADNFSFIHGLFLKCGAAIHATKDEVNVCWNLCHSLRRMLASALNSAKRNGDA